MSILNESFPRSALNLAAICLVWILFLQMDGQGLPQKAAISPATPAPTPTIELEEAAALLQKGKPRDAENSVRKYLSQHPDSAEAHYLLGQILFTEQQPKESLAEYTEGAKYHEPSPFDLKVVALDYVLLFDYADADKWFTVSLERNPQDSQAWYYLGRTKYNENRFQEAIRAFEQCLKLDPKNIKAEDNLGLSYQGLGEMENAATAFQSAIAWQAQTNNRNPQPWIDMGNLLLEQNRTEESVSYFRQAIEIAPKQSQAHEQLGKAYLRLDQLQKAQFELEKAAELLPQNAALHFELGQVYRKQGQPEKAKAEFARYSALTENPPPPKVSGLPH